MPLGAFILTTSGCHPPYASQQYRSAKTSRHRFRDHNVRHTPCHWPTWIKTSKGEKADCASHLPCANTTHAVCLALIVSSDLSGRVSPLCAYLNTSHVAALPCNGRGPRRLRYTLCEGRERWARSYTNVRKEGDMH